MTVVHRDGFSFHFIYAFCKWRHKSLNAKKLFNSSSCRPNIGIGELGPRSGIPAIAAVLKITSLGLCPLHQNTDFWSAGGAAYQRKAIGGTSYPPPLLCLFEVPAAIRIYCPKAHLSKHCSSELWEENSSQVSHEKHFFNRRFILRTRMHINQLQCLCWGFFGQWACGILLWVTSNTPNGGWSMQMWGLRTRFG